MQQKSYHKHQVLDMISTNLNLIAKGNYNGYVPIGVFEKENEADEFINQSKTFIN